MSADREIAWTIHWTTIDGHDSNRHAMVSGPPVEQGEDVRVVPEPPDRNRRERGSVMSWNCTRTKDVEDMTTDEAHVHPGYELHTISAACWCGPRLLDDVEVYPIYLHRDKLDREGPNDPES